MRIPVSYIPGQPTQLKGYATKLAILGVDFFFAIVSFLGALLITGNFELNFLGIAFIGFAPITLLLLRAISFVWFKTYLIIIRYVGEKDYKNVFYAVSFSSVLFFGLVCLLPNMLPKREAFSIVLVDYILLLVLTGGFRIVIRLVVDRLRLQQGSRLNTVIFGAGEMGALLARVLKHNGTHNYRVVSFFDDNPKVHKKYLNGVQIFNPDPSFEAVIKKFNIKVAIIAINQLSEERRIAFINQCLAHKIKVLKVPPAESWLSDTLQVGQLRNINFEDLLNRPPIQLDKEAIDDSINGKVVLVTGCAGSIGGEIVRQLLNFQPAKIIGLDQAETPLAAIRLSMADAVHQGIFETVIGDIRDWNKLERIFKEHQPSYVFHAAAYKHVPIMERFPEEAIKANVLGTRNLALLASKHRVEKFVMISTDKVVNPSNVMGASKRIAEIYVQALNFAERNKTQFITTRFGNVLGSNGSVIPIFREQIEQRQPVTVTHPEVTRFFMTIPEACQLVLEAGVMGHGGEIFIFDMGAPVRIVDLAEKMIQMAGLTPGLDVEIKFTGLRPGEKLYEELLDVAEDNRPTHHPKIKIAAVRANDYQAIKAPIEQLINTAFEESDPLEIVKQMKQIVPEFASQNSIFSKLD